MVYKVLLTYDCTCEWNDEISAGTRLFYIFKTPHLNVRSQSENSGIEVAYKRLSIFHNINLELYLIYWYVKVC